MTPQDRDRIDREAAFLGLSERSIRLDCLRLAVQTAAANPERVTEIAQSYVNFVLGLSGALLAPPSEH
jgi:hypothetical protein